jgi:ketosteroid isomerase-like protein
MVNRVSPPPTHTQLATPPDGAALAGNTERVRQAYGLFLDQDRSAESDRSARGLLELLAEDVEFAGAQTVWPHCRGKRALETVLANARRRWAEWSFEVEEVAELEAGQVLAAGTIVARMIGESEVARAPFAHLWTFDQSRATRIESFREVAEARSAALGTRVGKQQ